MTALSASTTRAAARLHRLNGLARLYGLARQRRHLAGLEDHMLADIGISPEEASTESRRPFWDVPRHWRG